MKLLATIMCNTDTHLFINNLMQDINYVVKIIFWITKFLIVINNKKNVFDFGESLYQIPLYAYSYSILSTHIAKRVPFDYDVGSKSTTR